MKKNLCYMAYGIMVGVIILGIVKAMMFFNVPTPVYMTVTVFLVIFGIKAVEVAVDDIMSYKEREKQ